MWAQLASHSALTSLSARAETSRLSSHVMMAPSRLSSSISQARSCSCSSATTAEEGSSHTLFQDSRNEASIRVPRMFHSHV
jgi:hypothetical protein